MAASAGGDRLLERIRRFVERESPSGDEALCATLAAEIALELEAAGAATEQIAAPGCGTHVRASLPGRQAGLQPVLVLGHLDTVHPAGSLAARPFRIGDGRAEGPGIFDMKAALAVLIEALALAAPGGVAPRRPLRLLVTCDEETGSLSSRPLIEQQAAGAAAVLVLEPPLPGGAAKTARKGLSTYRLEVQGRAAHSGIDPERGVSAIAELAEQIRRVLALADPLRGTTLNVGAMAGGVAVNVVAPEAWAEIEARYGSAGEGRRVDTALRTLEPVLPGASLSLERGQNRPPLERTAGVVRLYQHARRLAAELGFVLGEGSTGGASDGCLTAALGVPTLDGLGVQGDGAHTPDEYILIDDLPRRVALLARLFETL